MGRPPVIPVKETRIVFSVLAGEVSTLRRLVARRC